MQSFSQARVLASLGPRFDSQHLVPGGAKGVRLKSNFPNKWVAADIVGLIRDVRMRFRVSVTWGRSSHHECIGNCLSTEQSPATK
jgi:hypothetical protein